MRVLPARTSPCCRHNQTPATKGALMSIVIPFAPRPKPAQGVPETSSRPAQILFFTGVRYERQPEPADAELLPRARPRAARVAARAKIAGHPV